LLVDLAFTGDKLTEQDDVDFLPCHASSKPVYYQDLLLWLDNLIPIEQFEHLVAVKLAERVYEFMPLLRAVSLPVSLAPGGQI
jgi:hypothetical protein